MSYLQKLRLASVAAAMGVAHGSLQALEPEDFLVFNWRNLTAKPRLMGSEILPPFSVAVRENYVLGQDSTLKTANAARSACWSMA